MGLHQVEEERGNMVFGGGSGMLCQYWQMLREVRSSGEFQKWSDVSDG